MTCLLRRVVFVAKDSQNRSKIVHRRVEHLARKSRLVEHIMCLRACASCFLELSALFCAKSSSTSNILVKNKHGASARATFRRVAADVRHVAFFAKDSQHRSNNVHRDVFFYGRSP